MPNATHQISEHGAHQGHWALRDGLTLDLSSPVVMGILNVTPDSFSDGGDHLDPASAVTRAIDMATDGARAIDIGGESTRPGAKRVPPEEQIRRTQPVIQDLTRELPQLPISIDTTHATVAQAALDAGATIINDVSGATEDPGILHLAARTGAGIVLMHRLRPPEQDRYSDQYDEPPEYGDVVEHLRQALAALADRALDAGIARASIVLDPGLGFGKSVEDNLALIRQTGRLAPDFPLLSGVSRKSFVGNVTGVESPKDRLAGSIVFSVIQRLEGARVFRVHDVRAHVEALRAIDALPCPAD